MNNKRYWIWAWAWLWIIGMTCVYADVPPPSVYNPKPLAGDIILPMPAHERFGTAEMVFRAVRVPGSSFWANQERIIQIGDAAGGIFEGLQRTQISGSFPSADGAGWDIYLAKYELTVGQYLVVMGLDRLVQASADPAVQTIAGLSGRELRDALQRPLAFVSHQDIQEFIRQYNRWLFAAEHPERLAALPRMEGVPGFLRLPTEEEWEYVARGGLPAVQAGTFNDRLPFPVGQADRHAWHSGNARYELRSIGLRPNQASPLGFYDLFGNAQEMTSGFFRPEVSQGKPGGIAVRGGSVSTPAAELRSARREEFDAYAWNPEEQRMEERRSFDTGARLAIGSNVVVSTEYRRALVEEYEVYRGDLRRTTPVGRTLDNLVTQATADLDSIDPILEGIKEQNEDLEEPLTTVQAYMDKARERLELAQRETARSLAQDAARNGTILGFHLSRIQGLNRARDSALELVEISARYQDQLQAIERRIAEEHTAAREQFKGYTDKIAQLGDYTPGHIDYALTTLEARDLPARERVVLELLVGHLQEFVEQRRTESERWLDEFNQQFARFEDG